MKASAVYPKAYGKQIAQCHKSFIESQPDIIRFFQDKSARGFNLQQDSSDRRKIGWFDCTWSVTSLGRTPRPLAEAVL